MLDLHVMLGALLFCYFWVPSFLAVLLELAWAYLNSMPVAAIRHALHVYCPEEGEKTSLRLRSGALAPFPNGGS